MKSSKAQVRQKVHKIPHLQFETETAMTPFAGLVLFQALFQALDLKARLARCFAHLDAEAIFRRGTVFLLLVVMLLLGFRRLRAVNHLRGDPLVRRVVGLSALPDVSTLSRCLSSADARSVQKVRTLSRELVLDRLESESFRAITLDFDGSVQSSQGHAEGTAVGFNKTRKGARSYYPLFCTVSQLDQVFDLHHRPGNVHDSNGASAFMTDCHTTVRKRLPKARLEARFDSAFFDQAILKPLDEAGIEFTGSVPFQKFPELKQKVEAMKDWRRINDTWSVAEIDWRPKCWESGHRIVLYRLRRAKRLEGPLQLDLFEPRDYEYEYKVVVTNKTQHARTVLHFHNGRGSQEKLLGAGKQHAALGVVASRTLHGNQLFTLAGVMAHNLSREVQMRRAGPTRSTWPRRPARWVFQALGALRQRLILRVGRLTRPQRQLTLRIGAVPEIQAEFESYMDALSKVA